MAKLSKDLLLKLSGGYVVYLFLVWSSFRIFVSLPEVIEELWFKPVIWLAPIFWIWWLSGKKIEFFGGNWIKSVLWGLGLGVVYSAMIYLLVGFIDFSWDFNKLGVGFVTSVVENLVFAGFLLPVLALVWSENKALLVTGALFGLIHLPIAIFAYRADVISVIGLFVLSFSVGVLNGWIRIKTGNVIGAFIASFLWIVASL